MTDASSGKKKSSIAVIVGFNLFAVAVLFLFAELAGKVYLDRQGAESYPFLFNRPEPSDAPVRNARDIPTSFLDPHLGYAHDVQQAKEKTDAYIPGFAVYGALDDPEAIRILAFGGSTTDPFASNDESWPELLYQILTERGEKVCVLNGGVAGYSSNQELLKFLRDGLPLEPDIAIALNGVNDLGYVHSVAEHPMVHRFQDQVFTNLASQIAPTLFPNLMMALRSARDSTANVHDREITGVNRGTPVSLSPARNWRKNIVALNAVAEANHIQYLNCLQPIGGFGKYTRSEREEKELADRGASYLQAVVSFYTEAQALGTTLPFCADLTNSLEEERDVYTSDTRHQNFRGREALARAVAAELYQRGMLDAVPDLRHARQQQRMKQRTSMLSPRTEDRRENLCDNDSFEKWGDGAPLKWQVIEGQVAQDFDATDGLTAVRLIPSGGEEGATRIQQMVRAPSIRSGETLEIDIDAYAENGGVLGIGVYAKVGDTQEVISRNADGTPGWVNHPGGSQWRTLRAVAEIPEGADPESVRLVIMLRSRAENAALADRVSVKLANADE